MIVQYQSYDITAWHNWHAGRLRTGRPKPIYFKIDGLWVDQAKSMRPTRLGGKTSRVWRVVGVLWPVTSVTNATDQYRAKSFAPKYTVSTFLFACLLVDWISGLSFFLFFFFFLLLNHVQHPSGTAGVYPYGGVTKNKKKQKKNSGHTRSPLTQWNVFVNVQFKFDFVCALEVYDS